MASTSSREVQPATITRTTKAGRRLEYNLKVIQQPERARACGSGAKSSADRRPVDPPPVVELRIYELDGENRNDITFAYEANFFLFATLENARPIAHGRVQPQTPSVPVLTGMPVSGMAYLDRPTEAGYFIFPDLSVRHEGKYKLSFNLYEETKEAKDADAEPSPEQNKPKIPGGSSPDSSFDWRLEVKSAQFTVFSAKKFPGLAESTVLSRTVAEQGCRVRIRRDVRMRRRDGKMGNVDYDEQEEMSGYERAGRPPSVHDVLRERSRSLSSEGGSDDRQSYADSQHRLSGEYPSAPAGGHLSFGHSYGSQYAAPPPQFAQPQLPAQPSYQPGPSPYHSAPQYRPAPPAPQQSNYGFDRQPHPQSAYPSNPPREREILHDQDYRRSSVAGYTPAGPPSGPYPPVDTNYRHPDGYPRYRAHSPPMHSPVSLAPLKMPPIEPRFEAQTSPPGPLSINHIAPPLASPTYERSQDRSYGQYPAPAPLPPPSEVARTTKRSFADVFVSSAARQNEPLFNRMRPTAHHDQASLDDEEDFDSEQFKMQMSYKRADGSSQARELPSLD